MDIAVQIVSPDGSALNLHVVTNIKNKIHSVFQMWIFYNDILN